MKPGSKLHVIAVISNAVRYESRIRLFKQLESEMLLNPDVVLHVVEAAFGDREFTVTQPSHLHHLQLRTWDELWHKENMINLGVQRVLQNYPDAEYFAWIDADVRFQRPDWAIETMQQLQHHYVVQMWTHAVDLGPRGEALQTHHSFIGQYLDGKPYNYGKSGKYSPHWHPGYAWAMRREAWDYLGGLIETAILGAGDNHMAHALVGLLDQSCPAGLHENYYRRLQTWGNRAEKLIRRDVGVVPGSLVHYWHGKKKDRRYGDRWKILVEHQYDPHEDVRRDAQGLWQLVDHGDLRSILLRDDIRRYFRARNEDSIDLE